jgi:cytochrome c biogenesis protein CcdA
MNGRKNLTIYLGIGISLFGVVLYDPLGLLFRGTGLMVIALGLVYMFFGYKQLSEVEMVNKVVEGFEKK